MNILLWLIAAAILGVVMRSTGIFFMTWLLGIAIAVITSGLRASLGRLQNEQERMGGQLSKAEDLVRISNQKLVEIRGMKEQLQALHQRISRLEQENRQLRSALESGEPLQVLSASSLSETSLSASIETPTNTTESSAKEKREKAPLAAPIDVVEEKTSSETAGTLVEEADIDLALPQAQKRVEVSAAGSSVGMDASKDRESSLKAEHFTTDVPDLSKPSVVEARPKSSKPEKERGTQEKIPNSSVVEARPKSSDGVENEPQIKEPDESDLAMVSGISRDTVDDVVVSSVEDESIGEKRQEATEKASSQHSLSKTKSVSRSRSGTGAVLKTKPMSVKDEGESWESFIGSRLLSYVGIGILVLGLVSLLSYSLTQMGPLGRCLTGLCCGSLLVGIGFFLELKDNYQLFGRILMGGGWSVLYFTGYGAYHIKAMKLIHDPVLGTLVMATIAGGMLMHSIRYESEATTGVALLLSYVTLFVSDVSTCTHAAGMVLGLLIGYFAYRFRWLVTHLVGVILLYGGYGIWLYFQGPKSLTNHHLDYLLSGGFLVSLWVLFKAPDFAVPRQTKLERYLVPVIGLLNLFGLAVVRKVTHHVFQTKGAPATALYLGLLYLVLSQLLRRRGRLTVYRFDATVSVVLMMVGLWCVFLPYNTTMLSWMSLGLLVWLYSFYRKERYFRDLSNLVMCVSTTMALGGEWPKELIRWFYQIGSGEMLLNIQQTALPNKIIGSPFSMGVVGAIGAALLFLGSWLTFLWLQQQQQDRSLEEESRDRFLIVFSTATAMWSCYLMLTPFVCALTWSVLGFLLFLYGIYRREFVIRSWSHIVLLWTIVSGDLFGLSRQHIGWSMAWGGVLLFLDGFLTFRMTQREDVSEQEVMLEKFLVMGASFTMTLAASFLFATYAMVFAWICLAFVLFFYGYARGDDVARWCAYLLHIFAAVFASFLMMAGRDMITIIGLWQASRYVFLVLLAMALSYVYAALLHRFLKEEKTHKEIVQEEGLAVTVGSLAFLVAGWYSLPKIAVAVAYGLAGVLWLRLSLLWKRSYLRYHSTAILLLSGFWLFTVNLNAQGLLSGLPRRILSSLPVLGLWAYAGAVWQQMRYQHKVEKRSLEGQLPLLFSGMSFSAIQVILYYHAHYFGLGWAIHGLVLLLLMRNLQQPRYLLLALVAMFMASFSFCSLAIHVVGNPWSYFTSHLVLLWGPLTLFASHLWLKFVKLRPSATPYFTDSGIDSFLYSLSLAGRTLFGLMFCIVFLFVLTTLLPMKQFSLGWGVAGFLLGWYGLFGREKFFRWIALSLFGLAVGKIIFVDIFRFSTTQKIITFISVGLSLLFVSFLYNRFKDKLAELLLDN